MMRGLLTCLALTAMVVGCAQPVPQGTRIQITTSAANDDAYVLHVGLPQETKYADVRESTDHQLVEFLDGALKIRARGNTTSWYRAFEIHYREWHRNDVQMESGTTPVVVVVSFWYDDGCRGGQTLVGRADLAPSKGTVHENIRCQV